MNGVNAESAQSGVVGPQPARSRWTWFILGACLLVAALLAASALPPRRTLTPLEQSLVGVWSFPRPEDPRILHVYRFFDDGLAREEHYYLKSATPTVPTLVMDGVWYVEPNNRLTVDAPTGPYGLRIEAARQLRDFLGDQQADFPLPLRWYRFISAGRDALRFQTGDGKGGTVELVMVPFTSVADLKAAKAHP
jgi:hypothetical protein